MIVCVAIDLVLFIYVFLWLLVLILILFSPCQEIGEAECLQNDLFCVKWDIRGIFS